MPQWIIIVASLVAVAGAGLVVSRLRRHSSRGDQRFDLGQVSQSWITEHRVDSHDR